MKTKREMSEAYACEQWQTKNFSKEVCISQKDYEAGFDDAFQMCFEMIRTSYGYRQKFIKLKQKLNTPHTNNLNQGKELQNGQEN